MYQIWDVFKRHTQLFDKLKHLTVYAVTHSAFRKINVFIDKTGNDRCQLPVSYCPCSCAMFMTVNVSMYMPGVHVHIQRFMSMLGVKVMCVSMSLLMWVTSPYPYPSLCPCSCPCVPMFNSVSMPMYSTYLKLPQVTSRPFSRLRTVMKINQKYS